VSAVSLSRAGRILAVAVAVVFTIGCEPRDQEAAARHLAGRPRLSMVKDAIRLEYVENRGGFLSLGRISGGAADGRVRARAGRAPGRARSLGLPPRGRRKVGPRPALLWAGGVANLGDRIARGSVIDFLNLGVGTLRTGIFNVADVAIMAGALLIALELLASRPAESGLAPEGPPQG
jgi:signal peptidase II